MPNLTTIKQQLKRQITTNLGKVIQELGNLIDPKATDLFNDLIVLEQAYQQLGKDQSLATDSREKINQRTLNLTQGILQLIDKLADEDVLLLRLLQYEIHDKILVITKSPERKTYMQQFFPTDYFKQVAYDNSGEAQAIGDTEIVIYDDYPPAGKDQEDALLKHYLQDTSAVVLYFGRHSPLVWQYPEKAYATNSVFSLHARIKEMSDYLKYKQAYEAQQG